MNGLDGVTVDVMLQNVMNFHRKSGQVAHQTP